MGKGHAIRIGVEAAEGQLIFFSDIDFSVSLNQLPAFINALRKTDMAIGSRRLHDSNVIKHQNQLRETLGKSFTMLSNIVLGLNHTDLTCGFKGFKKTAAKNIFSQQKLNGWAFDSEILFLAHRQHYTVVEVPVIWKNDPLTKVNILRDAPNSLFSLLRIRLYGLVK